MNLDLLERESLDLSTPGGLLRWQRLLAVPGARVSLRVVDGVAMRVTKTAAMGLAHDLAEAGRPLLCAWTAPEGYAPVLVFCPARRA